MNYKKHYDLLVKRGKSRILEGYGENHHIIPKCLGGTDDSFNIVRLTAEEHYLAHQLLVKMYPDIQKLVYAANMMTISDGVQKRNNKLYGWLKKHKIPPMTGKKHTPETKERIRLSNIGKNKGKESWNKGKSFSEESKRKMSISQKNKAPMSEETRLKISLKGKLRKLSEEHKLRIGLAHKGEPKSEQAKLRMKEAWIRRKLKASNE